MFSSKSDEACQSNSYIFFHFQFVATPTLISAPYNQSKHSGTRARREFEIGNPHTYILHICIFVKYSVSCVDENGKSLNEIKKENKRIPYKKFFFFCFVRHTNGKGIKKKKALRNEPEIEQVPYVRE